MQNRIYSVLLFVVVVVVIIVVVEVSSCLQCFDTVGWMTGRVFSL